VSEECGLMFDNGYDDISNDFYRETRRKARKPHVCGECKCTIAPGETYLYVVGKHDGDMWIALLCAACDEIVHEFNHTSWTFGGQTWDDFDNAWASGAPLQPCLNRLTTVAAKTKLRDMWLKSKGVLREREIGEAQP
jgi:hypothetical protein